MRVVTILSLALFAACATSNSIDMNVMRVGQLRPSLPPDCKVQFADAPAFAAMLLLTQVGMITVHVPAGQIDAKLNEEVRRRACGIGGDVVTFNVGMNMGNTEMVQFLVFKKPADEPPAKPAPSTQTTNL